MDKEDSPPIHNQGPIHGQNIAQQQWITQHFHRGEAEATAPLLPPVWNLPFSRNQVFTGREDLLTQLAETLRLGTTASLTPAAVQAISGLGGIGKTQIAVEYAHRYSHSYQHVLWTRADTREALISGYVVLAHLLQLPQKNEQDQDLIVQAVIHWLISPTQARWLLILDNADELSLVSTFLPSRFDGHILLTTRAQAMGGLAQRIEVDALDPEMGALLLLRRAGLITLNASLETASSSDVALARAITEQLGGLPLALDQAGAYIEETHCRLSDYRTRYQTQRALFLQRRGGVVLDHPDSVATTWSLSFERVEQDAPAAADLLRCCAYLSPDAIPDAIFMRGAPYLGLLLETVTADPFLFDECIATLRSYSLLNRDPRTQALSVHRLVQAVLRDSMKTEEATLWKQRVVLAVNAASPEVESVDQWDAGAQWLPHALVCATWIEQASMICREASHLLTAAGQYLDTHARYHEAEPFSRRAFEISKQLLGAEHPETGSSLNNLALLYQHLGKFAQSELFFKQALLIAEQHLGPDHPSTASCLNNLGNLYLAQGRYSQAEPLLQRALTIREQQLGSLHPHTAESLNNLAELSNKQGQFAQAEAFYLRALEIEEQHLGPDHPLTASCLNNLGSLYLTQGRYSQAEPLLSRALAIHQQQFGSSHPNIVISLNKLAELYNKQGKFTQAKPLVLKQALVISESLGEKHPYLALCYMNFADLSRAQGDYVQAESWYQRSLTLREHTQETEHSNLVSGLNTLARLYIDQKKFTQAEALFQRALALCEQRLGVEHFYMAITLNNLARLYIVQGKFTQAERLLQRALTLCEQQLGPKHTYTAISLNNLALFYKEQRKFPQATSLFQRALALCEQVDHPPTQIIRGNYEALLRTMDLGEKRKEES